MIEPTAIALDSAALDACVGTYEGEGSARRVITREGGRVSMTGGGPRVEILPASATEFFLENSLVRITFDKDAGGRITAMHAGAWGAKDTFARAAGSWARGQWRFSTGDSSI